MHRPRPCSDGVVMVVVVVVAADHHAFHSCCGWPRRPSSVSDGSDEMACAMVRGVVVQIVWKCFLFFFEGRTAFIKVERGILFPAVLSSGKDCYAFVGDAKWKRMQYLQMTKTRTEKDCVFFV